MDLIDSRLASFVSIGSRSGFAVGFRALFTGIGVGVGMPGRGTVGCAIAAVFCQGWGAGTDCNSPRSSCNSVTMIGPFIYQDIDVLSQF